MEKKGIFKKYKKNIFVALRLAVAIVIAVIICQFNLDYFEFYTYDLRYQLKPTSPVSGEIQTIAVDTQTVETLGREPNARDFQQALKNLIAQNPKAIVFIQDPTSITGSYEEKKAMAEPSRDYKNIYFAANDLAIKGLENELQLPPPLDKIKSLSGPKTVDKKIFAKDNVTRRLIFSYQGKKTIHPLLAEMLQTPISKENKNQPNHYQGLFTFLSSQQAFIDFHPKGTYKAISFLKALKNQIPPHSLDGKLLLLGRDTLASTEDYIATPFSREINAMSTLEMHANMFDTLITNNAPIPAPRWLDLLMTSLISILTVFVVLSLRPAKGLLIILSSLAGFTLLSYLLMATSQFVISMAHPLLAIFICYYFFIPYRLILENRKSWEYYHKNKLLTQVEELKTNFMRMMSHDLKTPLARIQGMTNIVINDPHSLSSSQKEALSHIHRSSEELTEFVGSILNLGRIESKDIKLQIKSKDINTLLGGIIQKLSYLAKTKNIEIISEFEPLFSIPVDEDLLKQVFTNLIENAIKYSPENTKVLVSTEELDGKIIIQIADQGIGISSNEQENVFTKFYRSHKVTHTDIKGSGLGLYLANYFVDLHGGKIRVESEVDNGSTFTVELPMNPNQYEPQPQKRS